MSVTYHKVQGMLSNLTSEQNMLRSSSLSFSFRKTYKAAFLTLFFFVMHIQPRGLFPQKKKKFELGALKVFSYLYPNATSLTRVHGGSNTTIPHNTVVMRYFSLFEYQPKCTWMHLHVTQSETIHPHNMVM